MRTEEKIWAAAIVVSGVIVGGLALLYLIHLAGVIA